MKEITMYARLLAVAAVGLTMTTASLPALAFRGGGGSQSGDSWLNDAQRNPRFIEPYAQNDPSRYRASHPREGWYDRQRASGRSGYDRGHYGYGYGY